MFVHNDHAISLDGVRQVFFRNKGTVIERGVVQYIDACQVEVPSGIAHALLDKLKTDQEISDG